MEEQLVFVRVVGYQPGYYGADFADARVEFHHHLGDRKHHPNSNRPNHMDRKCFYSLLVFAVIAGEETVRSDHVEVVRLPIGDFPEAPFAIFEPGLGYQF